MDLQILCFHPHGHSMALRVQSAFRRLHRQLSSCDNSLGVLVQLVGQVLQLPVVRDLGLGKVHQKIAQALQTAGGAELTETASAGSSLVQFLTQAGKFFGKDPTKWEAVGQGKVHMQQ